VKIYCSPAVAAKIILLCLCIGFLAAFFVR
jgi:hypothetical protein